MRKMLDWLARRRLKQLLKRKGLHPKGLLADHRKSSRLRQAQAVLVRQEVEEGNLEDGGEEPPAKKKRGPYTNWFVPDLWNFIFAAVKKHPRNLYDALFSLQHNKKPGRLGSPFDKLTVQTLKG
jgi:predicted phosphoadenosine phosphosulfate sulfurtransferase